MIKLEFILYTGERRRMHNHYLSLTNREITNEIHRVLGNNSKKDIKGVRILYSNVHMLDLDPCSDLEYVEFDEGEEHEVQTLLMLPLIKNKLRNVPTNIKTLKCSAYTTITNMDELLESNTEIEMSNRI